jgi:hypothetical protein
MHLHGIVMSAELVEVPPDSGRIEMVMRLQGVGRDQPRRVVVPFDVLVNDPSLDPDGVHGKAFQAEVVETGPKRWEVVEIAFAGRRVLRSESRGETADGG